MRITSVQRVCVRVLGICLAAQSIAQAQIPPSRVDEISGTSAALNDVGTARFQKINDFRDNPRFNVDMATTPQFFVVGQLDRKEVLANGDVETLKGSAVIVSPCYALTAAHVVFGEGKATPERAKVMTFRGGTGKDEYGFFGHTTATPVTWGDYDAENGTGDWTLMRLGKCVGRLPQFGWAFPSARTALQLASSCAGIVAVGYSYKSATAQMSASFGQIIRIDPSSGLMMTNASMTHQQSGGPWFTIENGEIVLAAISISELHHIKDKQPNGSIKDTFDTWKILNSNKGMSAFEIMNDIKVSTIIYKDLESYSGKRVADTINPADTVRRLPLPGGRVTKCN